jgi:heme A synthase
MIIVIILGIIAVVVLLAFLSVWFITKKLHSEDTKIAQALMVLLITQFLLGMLTNLFSAPWYISLHIVIAIVILIFAIIFRMRTVKDDAQKAIGFYGLFGVVIAFLSGIVFMATSNNLLSLTMAIGFIIAFVAYTKRSFTPIHATTETKKSTSKSRSRG